MTPHELAAKLTGREYREEITDAEAKDAKEHGLVVVFGASDDLVEFRGAIDDEAGAYEGATFTVDTDGLVPFFADLVSVRPNEDELRDYFRREGKGREIGALWDAEGYSWVIRTEVPHATFEIMEDDEKYCLGIIFRLADCHTEPPNEKGPPV